MELFTKGDAVKLRSHLDKFLVADDDRETIRQSRKGDARRAVWTVETVEAKPNLIRLRSCHGTYLTASNKPLLLGMTGEKVTQTHSSNKPMDWQTQWEPMRDGFSVKLKSWCGKWMRANGGTPPWRNSVGRCLLDTQIIQKEQHELTKFPTLMRKLQTKYKSIC